MSVLIPSRARIGRRQRVIQRQGISFGPVALRFVTIVVLALLTIVYLVQSTRGSSRKMQYTGLEEKKEVLENEKQAIELESVRLRTLKQLKDTKGKFDLEPVTNAEDLSGSDNTQATP